MADALHQAAVAGDHEHVVVAQLGTEPGPEVGLGDGHADGVAEALTERTRGDLDTRGVVDLGMAGGAGFPLPERPQVVELEPETGEVEHRILQDRGVAVGQDEPVPIGPVRVGGSKRMIRLNRTWASGARAMAVPW